MIMTNSTHGLRLAALVLIVASAACFETEAPVSDPVGPRYDAVADTSEYLPYGVSIPANAVLTKSRNRTIRGSMELRPQIRWRRLTSAKRIGTRW